MTNKRERLSMLNWIKPELKIKKYFLIGLLIRLFLMPFTASCDLLWPYHRAYLIAFKHDFLMPASQILMNYLHALFLIILYPFIPYMSRLWNVPWCITHPRNAEEIKGMFNTYFNFISDPMAFWTLFWMKIPYLLFGIGCAFLLLRISKNKSWGVTAFKFWMLNPVIIFITYIFGRYEIIVIFFILLSLYFIKREKKISAVILLGIAIALRGYPILLVPFFIISLSDKSTDRIKYTSIALLPFILANLPRIFAGKLGAVTQLANAGYVDYLLSMNFPLGIHNTVYVFIVGYVLLILHQIQHQDKKVDSLIKYLLCFHLWLFATCYFHLQFFGWLVPYVALCIKDDKRLVKLFAVQAVCFFVYICQWGKVNTTFLLAPISPDLVMSLPSPIAIMNKFFSAHKLIGIFRSILTAVSLWMIWIVLKNQKSKIKN